MATGNGPELSRGFQTIYRPKTDGLRFVELLDQVSRIDPEVRIRFTSPHPKDFPDDLLYLIRERDNICKMIHMPAQSGSSAVLARMRRGYTRDSYVDLVARIRHLVPDVSLSSDFIAGFCGETDAEFSETLDLIRLVQYDMAYLFAYSLREKTHAHRTMQDDVPAAIKAARLQQMIDTFREGALERTRRFVGRDLLLMAEGPSEKALASDVATDPTRTVVWAGRSDDQRRVTFHLTADEATALQTGDYVHVHVTAMNRRGLHGYLVKKTRLVDFYSKRSSVSAA